MCSHSMCCLDDDDRYRHELMSQSRLVARVHVGGSGIDNANGNNAVLIEWRSEHALPPH